MDDLISRTSVLDVLKIYKVNLTVIDIIRGLPITNVAIPSVDIEQAYIKGREDGVNDFIKKSLIDE